MDNKLKNERIIRPADIKPRTIFDNIKTNAISLPSFINNFIESKKIVDEPIEIIKLDSEDVVKNIETDKILQSIEYKKLIQPEPPTNIRTNESIDNLEDTFNKNINITKSDNK